MSKLREVDWSFLAEDQMSQLDAYFHLLVEWNEKMNLTAITDEEEVYIKHFWDSLSILSLPGWKQCMSSGGRVIDIGTGAGFPGLPLAIVCPQIEFVLADSLQKRLHFLGEVIRQLGVKNVRLVHGRAEDLGRNPEYRGRFQVAIARAVAKLNVLWELMSPFTAVEGLLIAYKGPGARSEVNEAKLAAESLGVQLEDILEIELPLGYGHRNVVVAKQVSPTPRKFPRKPGIPQKQPL